MDMTDLSTPNAQVNIDPKSLPDIMCSECGNATFVPVLFLKKVSGLISKTGQEGLLPRQTFACNNCGHVNPEFVDRNWFHKSTLSDPTDAIESSDIEVPEIESD